MTFENENKKIVDWVKDKVNSIKEKKLTNFKDCFNRPIHLGDIVFYTGYYKSDFEVGVVIGTTTKKVKVATYCYCSDETYTNKDSENLILANW